MVAIAHAHTVGTYARGHGLSTGSSCPRDDLRRGAEPALAGHEVGLPAVDFWWDDLSRVPRQNVRHDPQTLLFLHVPAECIDTENDRRDHAFRHIEPEEKRVRFFVHRPLFIEFRVLLREPRDAFDVALRKAR